MFFKKDKFLSKLGFYNDQQGILNRYYREETGWNRHLEHTKNYILKSSLDKNKESVAVLGSGWLLDVPIAELSKTFKNVYLFDIIHPKEIKQKTKRYPNVNCIEADITGGATAEVYNLIERYNKTKIKEPLEDIEINGINTNFDFVVSVNLLNQLDILLTDNLKNLEIYDDIEIKNFKKKIQSKHLENLPNGKSCLVTDYEELIYKNNNLEKKNPLVIVDLPNGNAIEYWEWAFDTNETYYKNRQTMFNVIAMNF